MQGSITNITNSSGAEVAEYSYTAWGRMRNPVNWTEYAPGTEPALLTGRGYTGHSLPRRVGEHLNMFRLINMNARLYDPVLGRMLSPDNYVQMPGFSQNYNRYAYCLNNPVMYTDPDGNFPIFVLIGAVVGAYIGGLSSNNGELNPVEWNWKDGATWGGVIFGGALGAAGGYWITHPAAFTLNIGLATPYVQAGATIAGTAAATGQGTNWNYDFHWTTSAGGSGNINLNGNQPPSAKQISNNAIAEARANAAGQGVDLEKNLSYVNDGFSAIGTVAGGAEMYTRANAGARIAYTTFNGVSSTVSSAKVATAFKAAGTYTFYGSLAIDVVLSFAGAQSWGKTLVNTTVGGAAIAIGGVPGLVVGTGYLVMDKTGMFDGPSGPMNYTPPSIAMPDATRVAPPMLRYP